MTDPIDLSQKLIRCPSVTPTDAGALDVVQEVLESLGFTCDRQVFGRGAKAVDNLYARLGTKKPNLCFAGHTDVVPVGDEAAWTHPPFEAEIADGILYGRGAVDMKPAIAAWIAAVSEFVQDSDTPTLTLPPQEGGNKSAEQGQSFNGSISLLITGDEEGDGAHGTREMLEYLKNKGEKIDACVVGEPTNPMALGDMIKIGRRGSVSFDLIVNGIQGHVAYPDRAENPVTHIIRILHRLTMRKLDKGSEFFQPSNLEVTTVDVGNLAGNVIPARAKASFNIRFNDQHSSAELTKWVRGECEAETTQFVLTTHVAGESFLTQPGYLSETVSQAVKDVTGRMPELSTTGGTSDARFIKDVCPVVECGLINETAHKVDEQVATQDILMLTRIYLGTLKRYFV